MSRLFEGLNPQQHDAIFHDTGPMLVLAGAGSGKTRVITYRYAHLARKYSDSILAVTFTNKAAYEMKERLRCLTVRNLSGSWVGTFHSQCNRILRKEIRPLGYGNDFSIYDEEDQCGLIRHILKEFKIYEALYRGIQSRISSLKSACVTPQEFLSRGEGFGFEERLARVYVRYQDELKRCNAVDYDDLILLCIRIFEEYPEVLRKYQHSFQHILVDEFQDTNSSQYRLLKLLADAHENIFAVGDDDQSVYSFRGANVGNILEFETDYPSAKIIKLEQSYRCTKNILHASNSVIKSSSKRREKRLWSEKKQGEKVYNCWLDSEEEEAKYIARYIKELYLKGLYDYKDFAALYRINLQSRALEVAMRRERIPYHILGGISFFQRKEIKDVMAYMRLALNRNDNVSLRRIINTPPRGIGAATLTKMEHGAKKKGIGLFQSMKNIIKAGAGSAIKDKLGAFANLIEGLSPEKYRTAADMLRDICAKTNYLDFVDEDRAENVSELIASAEEKKLGEFIDWLSLLTNADDVNRENAVSLLTLHNAKGLEFPVVFITGVEEGVLPYFKAKDAREMDEERRLLYVGMTRAKDMLWLTGASRRRLYSRVREQEPSRFIRDLPAECSVKVEKAVKRIPTPTIERRRYIIKSHAAYAVGCRVKHPKWGVGVVRDCHGDGEDQKITVNFPGTGVKRLALRFANLERLT